MPGIRLTWALKCRYCYVSFKNFCPAKFFSGPCNGEVQSWQEIKAANSEKLPYIRAGPSIDKHFATFAENSHFFAETR
jgi:hypothetical protein